MAANISPEETRLRGRIRILLAIVILGLLGSGISSLPLLWESGKIADLLQQSGQLPVAAAWMTEVHRGLADVYQNYPFIGYGTDWLGFGHFVIAIFFLGPLVDPRRNLWIIDAGIVACLLVIPMALISGEIRHLPVWWRLIDCAFGVFGVIPLWLARSWARRLPR
ncbi:MAG TPA: hypothetical protein VGG02_11765 [Chthoniobacterales bacterium]|jgi:hypothetical protein